MYAVTNARPPLAAAPLSTLLPRTTPLVPLPGHRAGNMGRTCYTREVPTPPHGHRAGDMDRPWGSRTSGIEIVNCAAHVGHPNTLLEPNDGERLRKGGHQNDITGLGISRAVLRLVGRYGPVTLNAGLDDEHASPR